MPTKEEFLQRKPALTLNISGYFGTGKSLQAHSFPKCYTISCDPAGLETLRQPKNARYLNNLVEYDELHNQSTDELKEMFRETATSGERGSVYGCLARARELAAAGQIETLIIDGFTYFVDMRWRQINSFEIAKSANTGNVDTQSMYRNLGLYLHRFVASDLMTMASRNQLNIILTTHLKRESEEQVQGGVAKNRARKVALNSDIAPMIEGGFRNKMEGLVGASIYLDKKIVEGKPKYEAICDIATGLGTIVNAKNRYGLPARLDLTNGSLYDKIMESLQVKTTGPATTTTAAATVITSEPTTKSSTPSSSVNPAVQQPRPQAAAK